MTTESYPRAKAKQKAKEYLAMREAQQFIKAPNERLERSRAWLDKWKARPRKTSFNWSTRWPTDPEDTSNAQDDETTER